LKIFNSSETKPNKQKAKSTTTTKLNQQSAMKFMHFLFFLK